MSNISHSLYICFRLVTSTIETIECSHDSKATTLSYGTAVHASALKKDYLSCLWATSTLKKKKIPNSLVKRYKKSILPFLT